MASVELRRCTIRDCAIGVLLDRQETSLTAVECTFVNTKEAVSTRRGGAVHLERCHFLRNDVVLRLDDRVRAQYTCSSMQSHGRALFLTFLIWQVVGAARENESDRPLLRHDFILPPRFEFEGNHSLMPTMTPGGELSE